MSNSCHALVVIHVICYHSLWLSVGHEYCVMACMVVFTQHDVLLKLLIHYGDMNVV